MNLGINLAAPDATQPEAPFLDLMRLRAQWTGAVDATGAPTGTGTLQTPVVRGVDVSHDIIVSGVDSVQVVGGSDAKGTSPRKPVDGLIQFASSMTKLGGTIQLKVVAAGAFTLALVPTKHRARFDAGELFNPDLLSSLSPFVRDRFMDWCRVNSPTLLDRRALLSDNTWNAGGVPVEIQAALSTLLRHDMWTNIPHVLAAHPEEVRGIMTAGRDALDPSLTAFFEWSNEVWNSGFAVNKVAKAAGDPAVYYGQQSAALSKIAATIPGKIKIILAWQSGGTSGIKKVVEAYKAAGGDMARVHIACAPYLTSGERKVLSPHAAAWSKCIAAGDTVGAAKETDAALAMFRGELTDWITSLKGWGDYAKSLGVPFDAYEVNFALATIPPNQAFCQALQFGDVAPALLMAQLDACEAAGMSTAMIFNDCQAPGNAGQWGMWPYPGADPYPIGKAVVARAAKAKAPKTGLAALAQEVADMQVQLASLAGRIAAAAVG